LPEHSAPSFLPVLPGDPPKEGCPGQQQKRGFDGLPVLRAAHEVDAKHDPTKSSSHLALLDWELTAVASYTPFEG
jgi:hypothetical protein